MPLSELFEGRAAGYLVEFFAAENLYIPFPAVMVNHRGPRFLNTVHAYNRVLNDVFEDAAINRHHQREASIDVRLDEAVDTFFVMSAGANALKGSLGITLQAGGARREAEVPLDLPRFGHREISLAEAMPGLGAVRTGMLTLRAPPQPLFYGRVLTGQRHRDGAWTANHSYYDSSDLAEYWEDGGEAWRLYPHFPGIETTARMYPIMSPGRLALAVELFDREGRACARVAAGEIESPGTAPLEIAVTRLAAEAGLETAEVAAFALRALPMDGALPTRVNHQLVQEAGGLASSINVSMGSHNVFVAPGKTGFAWGQVPVGAEIESRLGLCANDPDGADCAVEATFYGPEGELARRRWTIPGGGSLNIDVATELTPEIGEPPEEAPAYLWYTVRGARPDLAAYSLCRHRTSGHCSGEHSF